MRLAALLLSISLVLASVAGCGSSAPRTRGESDVSRTEAVSEARVETVERRVWTPSVLLWQVGDRDHPSWVFATLNYGVTLEVALPDPHDAILDEARAVVAPMDPRLAQIEATAEVLRMGRRERLDRMLGRELWPRLMAALGPDISEESARITRPSVLASHLSRIRMAEVEAIAEGRDPVPFAGSSSSASGELLDRAIAAGVPIVSLDASVAESVRELDEAGRELELQWLRYMIEHEAESRLATAEMRAAYLAQDERSLAALCDGEEGDGEGDGEEGTDVVARVRAMMLAHTDRWMTVIDRELEAGGVLIALPACDVLFSRGVLARLRERGLHVERLGSPPGTPRPPDERLD